MTDTTAQNPEPGFTEERPRGLKNRGNLFVLLIGLFMLCGLFTLAWIGRPPRAEFVGEKLPLIDLQPLVHSDGPLSNEDLEGKVTLLHFWGTWCGPCQVEFPEFAEMVAGLSDEEGVVIASVSCSPGAEMNLDQLKQETEEYLSQFPNPIPTYADSTAMSRQQFSMLSPNGSFGYPTTVLVNKEGEIIEAILGAARPGELDALSDRIRGEL
ncbi:MAG: TlpA family protein disulfide reductase [Pirellulaceae bacterium]